MRLPGSSLYHALLRRQSWQLLIPLVVLLSPRVSGHGALHERIASLNTLIAAQPEEARLRFELADVYCQHGEWQNALAEIDRTESLAPQKYPTGILRGQALLGTGQFAQARSVLDEFIAKNPGHSRALVIRARTLVKLGQHEEALADYRQSLLTVSIPQPEFVQEVADALAAHGYSAEAIAVLNQAIAKLGPIPSLTMRAMELEAAAGQFDAALSRVDLLEKTAPRREPWMAKRAALLARAGRGAEARAAWEALQAHLASLPNLERGTYAMQRLAEEARAALHTHTDGTASSAVSLSDVRL